MNNPPHPARGCGRQIRTTALALALAGLGTACGSGQHSSDEPARNGHAGGLPPAPVVVAKVEEREFAERISAVGTARANEATMITARVQGLVEDITFEEGSTVDRGQLLIALDAAEERAAVASAEAAFEQAEARYRRLQSLAQRDLASRDALEEQSERVKSTRANLDLARARLDQRRIRAPFAGIVGIREVSPGALITPGTAIVSLDDISVIRATFSVPEVLMRFLQPGNTVAAEVAAWPGRPFEGTVSRIDSRVDERTRAIRIEARFDNPDGTLKPGMLLRLRASASPRQALFVPEGALAPVNDEQFVWRLNSDDAVERVAVRIGAREPGTVEIREGLSAGDRVVIEGTANLRENRPVRVTDRQPAGRR